MASNEHEPVPPDGYELVCERCGAPIHRAGNWSDGPRYVHDRARTTTSDTDCGMTATPRRIALTGAVATDDHLGTLRAPAPSDGPAAPLEPGQPHVDVLERRQRTTGADQLHLFEQRPGIMHNLVAHPMLVLWPRLGEWLHAHTSATRL